MSRKGARCTYVGVCVCVCLYIYEHFVKVFSGGCSNKLYVVQLPCQQHAARLINLKVSRFNPRFQIDDAWRAVSSCSSSNSSSGPHPLASPSHLKPACMRSASCPSPGNPLRTLATHQCSPCRRLERLYGSPIVLFQACSVASRQEATVSLPARISSNLIVQSAI